jgi:hypothetical protein
MLSTVAAIGFAVLASAVIVFQLALVLGAPWGELTLGGRYRGALPLRLRAVPLASAVLIGGFSAIVLARAGLAFASLQGASGSLVWFVVAYCAAGVLANAATPSRRERALWLPVVGAMLLASAVVALQAV